MKWLICTSLIFIVFCSLGFRSKSNEPSGIVKINFNHFVKKNFLKLDSMQYKNELGQTYSISKFKYYVGNIQLKGPNGKSHTSHEYFLINEEEGNSKSIELQNIPDGEYDEIIFLLGVDSLHNCSGAQSGSLDPINGMFWNWNTGYIFLKLEGNANSCNTPSNMFEYHTGGYKKPYNSIREIRLKLPNLVIIKEVSKVFIRLDVAIDEILKNPNTIDFSKTPTITDQTTSSIIANNCKDVFTVSTVSNER